MTHVSTELEDHREKKETEWLFYEGQTDRKRATRKERFTNRRSTSARCSLRRARGRRRPRWQVRWWWWPRCRHRSTSRLNDQNDNQRRFLGKFEWRCYLAPASGSSRCAPRTLATVRSSSQTRPPRQMSFWRPSLRLSESLSAPRTHWRHSAIRQWKEKHVH